MCHQDVSGVVISITRPGLSFWPLCVPSGCMCYCMLMKYLLFQHHFSLTGCMYFISISYCNTHMVLSLTCTVGMCTQSYFFSKFSQILITCRKYVVFLAKSVICHSQSFRH